MYTLHKQIETAFYGIARPSTDFVYFQPILFLKIDTILSIEFYKNKKIMSILQENFYFSLNPCHTIKWERDVNAKVRITLFFLVWVKRKEQYLLVIYILIHYNGPFAFARTRFSH